MALSFTSSAPVAPLPQTVQPLSAEEAEALLRHLLASRWPRLPVEFGNPLDMLFDTTSCQWTAGWGTATPENPLGALIVLVWETDAFTNDRWILYIDSKPAFTCPDHPRQQPAAQLCHQLLEGVNPSPLSSKRFLERMMMYSIAPHLRESAMNALWQTLETQPALFNTLKSPLLACLEQDLSNAAPPTLEVLKIHRLAVKTPLIALFRNALTAKFPFSQRDKQRLHTALNQLQAEYRQLGQNVHPLCRPTYDAAHAAFRQVLTDGVWHTRLRLECASRNDDFQPRPITAPR